MKADTTIQEAITRSSLSSSNHMEMLTFRLTDGQMYGINVFKIIEIVESPSRIDRIPHSHPAVKGIVDFRGKAISVIDLSQAIDMAPVDLKDGVGYLVICEYNKQLNAFLVSAPEVLLTRSWESIKKPEGFNSPSLVAIAYDDHEEMIMLLDIEGILADIIGIAKEVEAQLVETARVQCQGKHVILVDDSSAALNMMKTTLADLGMKITEFDSAVNALKTMQQPSSMVNLSPVDLIISDIEMPGMDGFTFIRSLRTVAVFQDIPIILHSSMSNPTNEIKAREAGANAFIAKFDPNVLIGQVIKFISG